MKNYHYVVFRSFQGFTHFSSVVNKKQTKLFEEVNPKRAGDHRLRIFFVVKSPIDNTFKKEKAVIVFFSKVDMDDFKQSYTQVIQEV